MPGTVPAGIPGAEVPQSGTLLPPAQPDEFQRLVASEIGQISGKLDQLAAAIAQPQPSTQDPAPYVGMIEGVFGIATELQARVNDLARQVEMITSEARGQAQIADSVMQLAEAAAKQAEVLAASGDEQAATTEEIAKAIVQALQSTHSESGEKADAISGDLKGLAGNIEKLLAVLSKDQIPIRDPKTKLIVRMTRGTESDAA
jgi:hypothetical protein